MIVSISRYMMACALTVVTTFRQIVIHFCNFKLQILSTPTDGFTFDIELGNGKQHVSILFILKISSEYQSVPLVTKSLFCELLHVFFCNRHENYNSGL